MAQKVAIDRDKSELEKYIYYFERYHNHDGGFKVAQELVQKMKAQITELHEKYKVGPGESAFLSESAKILVECKRVLKWSYAFGYYLAKERRSLYEFGQKDLEKYAEELLESIEMHYKTEIREELGKLDLKAFTRYKNEVVSLKEKCKNVNELLFFSPLF